MKKDMLSLWLVITVIIGSFVGLGCYYAHVKNYQEATRAYIYGAYKNGAINERECAYLLDMASSFHAYPEVRKREAVYARKMVDRAYQEQQKNN